MKQSKSNQYKLKKDKSGTVWVSIQPLMQDIVEHIKIVSDIDVSNLEQYDQREYDIKLLGLNSIHQFLGALLQEQQLLELRKKHD